ncbi:MAG: ATP synthase F1 subunit epsilon [Deltaproteobacteria bacterium]|nr:MAG: ATP synthase F1 subunit epsilon [Deltaproteobacteria bacterium]TMQ18813.1 MAG: ATP synthase F1 subunit epsilon [Deltaproteobacteria bacterium]
MASGLPTILGVNLVTPRGVVAHTDADSVQAPGELGEFELLPGHVPMLTALKPGVLTIGTKARARYAVSSGYLRVDPGGAVEILVEQAIPTAEIDADEARKELAAAEAELARWGDRPLDGEYVNMQQRAGWARARLDALAQ